MICQKQHLALFFVNYQRHNNQISFTVGVVADAVAFAFGAVGNVAREQFCFRTVVVVFGGAA